MADKFAINTTTTTATAEVVNHRTMAEVSGARQATQRDLLFEDSNFGP